MSLTIEPTDDPRDDADAVEITTTDARGVERVYKMSIGHEEMATGYIVCGKRVDEDAPDEPAGGGPSQRVWEAAREHFRSEGWEVWR
jgi:hypothetical protein